MQYLPLARRLVQRGASLFHVHIFGPSVRVHDAMTGTPGSFDTLQRGIRDALDLGVELLAEIQVVRDNYLFLQKIVDFLHGLGVNRVHLSHARPVFADGRFFLETIARLNTAASFIRSALER